MTRPLARIALLLAAAACSPRTTLTETHGRSTRAAFERQVANPGVQQAAPRGLDSQEASIVAESFRESLAGKGQAKEAPVLYVAPPAQPGAGQRQRLAPSVPQDR